MIRDKTADVETLATTLGADRLKFEVDEDGLAHICDMLIGQYSDEEMAVLREYSTNARDSHIAAGCPERPIEVTLPCGAYDIPSEEKGRFLKIKDYGVGLSVEEIETIFSRIGKSTKDESNEQQGMMGIGGKSGLVPSFGSFQIVAIKDGKKATVMAGRDEATEPVLDLASVVDTDEPNGVEIILPAPRHNGLARRAVKLFRWWPEGSVLVDGKAPERKTPKIEIAPDMWVCDDLESDYVVMGDVAYPVTLDAKLGKNHHVVFFVPIGAVTIAPSREALRMTPKTKDALAVLLAEFDQKVKTVVQDKVNAAKNKAEAMALAIKWRSAFSKDADLGLTYKGVKIPVNFTVTDEKGTEGITVTEHDSEPMAKNSTQKTIYAGTLRDAVLVHGYPGSKFTAVQKKKLEAWAKANNLTPKHYVLTEKRLAHGWFDSKMRVDWETVKKIKITTSKGKDGRERPKGSYDMYVAGHFKYGVPAADISLDEDIFYMDKDYFVVKGRNSWHNSRRLEERKAAMFRRYPDATFVELTSNRVAKFRRDFPEARPVKEILDEIYDEFVKTVNKAALKRLIIEESSYNTVPTLRRLDIDKVNDPKVKTAIRLAKRPLDTVFKSNMQGMLRITGRDRGPELTVKWKNPLDRYPLVDTSHLEHTYLYMNAVYAQEKK